MSSPQPEAGHSLQKAHFVVSVLSCLSGQQGIATMPMEPPDGRKVKSGSVDTIEATDRHERAKDYLSPAEMARLLDAARPAGTGCIGTITPRHCMTNCVPCTRAG